MPLNTIPNKGLTNQGYPSDRLVTPIIINGDMSVAQRSTSTSSYGSVAYSTVDRFKTVFEVGTYTVSQESLSSGNAYNAGFRKAFKALVTSTAAPGSAGAQTTFEQRIEGQNLQIFKKGTSNAESFTLAFWVKSSKTGSNLQVNLRDSDNTRQVGGTYDISAANTWEKKIINFPADTTGAFNNDNGTSLTIEWWLDGGSNYSGGAVPTAWEASSNADRNVTNFDLAGATDSWHITGVQLEVGEFDSTFIPAFPFESFASNLQRCLRYYQKSYDYGTAVGTDTYTGMAITRNYDTSSARDDNPYNTPFQTKMRATPTITIYSKAGNSGKVVTGSGALNGSTTEATVNSTVSSERGLFGINATLTATHFGQAHWTAESEL
tara:strand:+ start:67 stop:1200 length:1134 start_codon:yes stop_codon:yes gene_type:complete